MAAITVKSELQRIGDHTLLHLPKAASEKLPSRGVTMVEGALGGVPFKAALEPDGHGSHWLDVTADLIAATGATVGDTVALEAEVAEDWLEPDVPDDIKAALDGSPEASAGWADTTMLARWDWIRWMRATANAATREKRIRTAVDMLSSGKRRPCCFNRSQCTVPAVSKSGKLVGL